MKNEKIQEKLDIEKWLKSEKLDEDQAGKMEWCKFCSNCSDASSKLKFPCATAFNKMKRKGA